MDRFLNEQNIARFRRLGSATTNAAEREQILRLLGDEETKFKQDRTVGGANKTRLPNAEGMLDEGAGQQEPRATVQKPDNLPADATRVKPFEHEREERRDGGQPQGRAR